MLVSLVRPVGCPRPWAAPPALRPREPRLSPSLLLFAERTLMLPLSEGSLLLRADDEDSLISDDSFFSATEVSGEAGGHGGWVQGGRAPVPLGQHGRGEVPPFPPPERSLAATGAAAWGLCSGWGWGA